MGKSIKELIAEARRLAKQAEAEAEKTSAAHRDMAAYLGVDPATQHFASLECYENGCKTCRIPPMTAKSPAAVTGQQLATQNAQTMLGAQAAANAQQQASVYHYNALPPKFYTFDPAEHERMLKQLAHAFERAASPKWLVDATPATPVTAPRLDEAAIRADSRITPSVRTAMERERQAYGDVVGSLARGHVSDAIAGCRLGCGCKQHSPAKPAPWVPSVDEWDLLPNAD